MVTVSVPATTSPRPKRRLVQVTVGGALLCGLVAVLVTARSGRIEPDVPAAPLSAADEHDAQRHEPDPWTIIGEPVERVGYRHGRQHVFDVVPLGPTAVEVEIRTARAFLAMRSAAADAGVDLRLESGFRTAEQQLELYRAWRKGRGNKAARPGQSNHQSGRALDISVGAEPGALAWLESNGALFGFARTVKSEPWHWEYVDVPVARGATKHVSRKASKKVSGHASRPARTNAPAPSRHSSRTRVASSRR